MLPIRQVPFFASSTKLGLVFSGFAMMAAFGVSSSSLAQKKEDGKAQEAKQSDDKTQKATDSSRDRTQGSARSSSTGDPKTAAIEKDAGKSEKQLAEERKARDAARKRGEITFDDLKFDIEKGGEFKEEMLTESNRELNKKVVKLRGFILPTSVFQQSGIKQFVLVRDNQECCFGPGASLYDCVIVEMAEGKTATFSTRVVTVKGKFEIDTESFQYPDGGYYAIYKMTAEEVR